VATGPFLAVDWGTSNLRAWRLDGEGQPQERIELALGVGRLEPGEAERCFETQVRPALSARELPALMCGMIGSTLGWRVAPYLDCPASPGSMAGALLEASPGVRIAPGLRCEGLAGPDVMRGEETQVLGWLAARPERAAGRHILCLPGTHAKWVLIEAGAIMRFHTAMTGELYDLLGRHGVLKFAAVPADRAFDAAAFDAGVAAAGDGGALTARLFALRGLTLAGRLSAETGPDWLSGLLIGAEAAALWPLMGGGAGEMVTLIGAGRLCDRYARALAAGGVSCRIADGEKAVLSGLRRIWSLAP
jgi:2-dehydro-3-deoxygalactonokinase